ncbi:BON domain-containing protein [Uliginosibacterium sp. 31-16]|uniref:BON domain-containing protein n=1 Tax=Uliginosibacterium sp. 31-16 TaxID=3068315 RepID=UPI00273D0F72|nr:BON domain-containing protein [Uliginosibacterium sp. 31-16]MDP5238148.1 BON domain-containing protein [Uliginosibacterium sp. 31-16]
MTHHTSLRTLVTILSAAALLQACVPLAVVGVGTGVTSTLDRRTYGEQIMDREIEVKFNRSFPKDLEARTAAQATSFNRWVLLTGQAIDASSRSEVENLARGLANVREVFNEISIGYPASFSSRNNDSFLTTKVKARLFDSPYISGHHVKVVTESGIVYLLGEVTAGEAQAATEVARNTSGVQKVVSMFEVISPERAKQLNALPEQSSSSKTAPASAE